MAIPRLIQLGLSEKEAKVYAASLEIGAATADELAKQTKINRSTTYVQLQELMQFGLMSTFKKGKKTYFAPESPHNLKRIIERRHRELDQQEHLLESFVPELLSLYSSTGVRPTVRSFEGKDGLITMRNEVLKTKAKEIYIAVAYDHMRSILSFDELKGFTDKRVKLGIHSRVIYAKEGEDMQLTEHQELRRVDGAKFPFESDIYIYGGNVAFASYKGTVTGVIIESQTIAKTMHSIFAILWENLDKK